MSASKRHSTTPRTPSPMTAMNTPVLTPDLSQAKRFLDALEPNGTFIFQLAPEREDSDQWPRILNGTLESVWPKLVAANLAGAAIWVQINEAQGRKDTDVTRIRAYFVDLDGSDSTKLLASGSGANIIIESSPGKFHGYWLTGDGPVKEFKQRQHALAQHFGGDPSICNPGRVMRLPGTIHWKSTPYISTILRLEGTLS